MGMNATYDSAGESKIFAQQLFITYDGSTYDASPNMQVCTASDACTATNKYKHPWVAIIAGSVAALVVMLCLCIVFGCVFTARRSAYMPIQ